MLKSFAALLLLAALAPETFGETNNAALIPLPWQMEAKAGFFTLPSVGPIKILADSPSLKTAELLAGRLRQGTGSPIQVRRGSHAQPGSIQLTTQHADPSLGAEGYELDVSPDSVTIRAPTQAGLFYGTQTLLQLLPPEIFASQPQSGVAWQIPCVAIRDQPRFQWRGLMLDVSRHFFSKAEVEQVLDVMALHKLNTFHWHLTDDQGWRIEIKKYPRLTEIGGWRTGINFKLDPKSSTAYGPDGRYGGFYTQKDIREVVQYAAVRHITIVPEIEMPGHASAALSAYPQFSCTGQPYSMDVNGGVFNGIYCPGNDQAFTFVENILTEVFQLFPGQYIHVGGDEVLTNNWAACPKCQARMKAEGLTNEAQLESYFIRRVEKFVNAHDRTLIGWSEIRDGGLTPKAVIMDWIGGATEAAANGHDVVMSPLADCYLDHYQSHDQAKEPHTIGGFLPLSQIYAFEPIPAKLEPQFQSHILGAQANLWTEYVPSIQRVEYMAFPRELALAEVTWSPKASRNFEDFLKRLQVDDLRLDALGVNYRRNPTDVGSVETANPSQ